MNDQFYLFDTHDPDAPALPLSAATAEPELFTAPQPKPTPTPKPSADGARIASRFRTVADGLEKQIEHCQRPMTQNATPKRMKEYRSRLHDGRNLERIQKALRALAEAHEDGSVPCDLAAIRTKDEVRAFVCKYTAGGGYYDVIEAPDYSNTTPPARLLQAMMEGQGRETSEAKAERERLSKISQLEADIQFRQIPGFFPTPAPIVQMMIDRANLYTPNAILEPSAGKGDIAEAIRAAVPGARLTVVEYILTLQQILTLKGFAVAESSDFLEHRGEYDRILMNPPFERAADIDHVRHAYELLKDGGRIVAIMSESGFYRSDRKATEFREWLDEKGGESEKLESGSFTGKEAFRQTGVASRLVVIDKR